MPIEKEHQTRFWPIKNCFWETFPSKTLVISAWSKRLSDQDEWAFNTRIFWFGMDPQVIPYQNTIHRTGMNLPTWMVDFYGKWLGKYASPMHASWVLQFCHQNDWIFNFFCQLDDFRFNSASLHRMLFPGFHTDLMLWIISVPYLWNVLNCGNTVFFPTNLPFLPIRNWTSCTVWGCTLMLITRSLVMSGCLNSVVCCWKKNCS